PPAMLGCWLAKASRRRTMDLARHSERRPTSLELASDASRDVAGRATWSAAAARAVARAVLAAVSGAPLAIVLPSGEEDASARSRFADLGALLGFLGPASDLHFGDAYADGRIAVEGDLLGLLEAVFAAPEGGWLADLGARWRRLVARGNSIRRSRANVHHHYDLGNDFYALWLDREMVYTCAYFPTPAASLEEAQVAKMEHVARKLRLHPDESVIEAGCGWGALTLHLARRHGVRVRAFNVSAEQ